MISLKTFTANTVCLYFYFSKILKIRLVYQLFYLVRLAPFAEFFYCCQQTAGKCLNYINRYIFVSEVNNETLNVLKYVRPGGGFVPKFPVFGKVEVNGLNEEPLFTYLKVL